MTGRAAIAFAASVLITCTPAPRNVAVEVVSVRAPTSEVGAPEAIDAGPPSQTKDVGLSRTIVPGDLAPPFVLSSVNGTAHATIGTGKVVVLHVFATWCGPCAQTLPEFERLYAMHRKTGLAVVACAIDDRGADVRPFALLMGATYPVAWDDRSERTLMRLYGPPAMPTTYVIDRHGIVKHIHGGYRPTDIADIDAEVKALF